ncbi:MAG: NADH-quinone oxidoreductase subunit G [OCS116 cluster bacterium]|nr:NADH-quinone oxidoreductase subunit G [OCS116 cluster bacterium]
MPKLTIDGKEIEVADGLTILQACEEADVEIPRFCYHERLSIAGNCRMCLVEMERAPKPVASCAMPAGEGMVIKTNTPLVKKAREGVMEFMLINHPLDCPICDQGGECDLQDQSMAYGLDGTRYTESKRAMAEQNLGPLIKTEMTRCISCTRCVRFTTEVAGVHELGQTGRGEDAVIVSYLGAVVDNEMSGNIIDLCPVGALTSRPYEFNARPWELRKTQTVDVMDAVGSNIRVDVRGREVMRVMPINNDDVNEEWISDKTRFIWDGLKTRRLDTPYIRANGSLKPASWSEAFEAIAAQVKKSDAAKMAALVGDLNGAEEIFAFKTLMDSLGVENIDCRNEGSNVRPEWAGRAGYIFNSSINGIEDADALLIIGSNPRLEATVLNSRIVKAVNHNELAVAYIGEQTHYTYPAQHIGNGAESLNELLKGKHSFAKTLKDAKNPMIIVGQGAFIGDDAKAIFETIATLANDIGAISDEWNGLNFLQTAASRVAALDLGCVPKDKKINVASILAKSKAGELDMLFLLGADEMKLCDLDNSFIVYMGSHGDVGANSADVILPSAAYTEKNATYVNLEGRAQQGIKATFAPGDAKEDWAILRALSTHLGQQLPFDNLDELRIKMYQEAPQLANIGSLDAADISAFAKIKISGDISSTPLVSTITDYYHTNPIARASKIMDDCKAAKVIAKSEATGTNG